MAITYRSLLVGGAEGWHDGGETITWAVLTPSDPLPNYYTTITVGGKPVYDLSGNRDPSEYLPASAGLTQTDADLAALAVQAWNEVANVNLVLATGPKGQADVLFGSFRSSDPDLYGFVADFPGTLGSPSRAGDVWLNSANNAQAVAEYGDDGWQTYLHELGHALGLHHPNEDPNNTKGQAFNDNQYTVMSYEPHPAEAGSRENWPITPMMLDIQAIQALYGPNLTTRTGDTTYFGPTVAGSTERAYPLEDGGELSDGHVAILTIWDAGGVDTINAAAQTRAVTIDLKPGSFSTIGPDANNIGIAYAVTEGGEVVNYIENAIGGRGDDSLQGNDTQNVLTGGLGADILNGKGDADTFVYLRAADSTKADQDFIKGFKSDDVIDLSALDAIAGTLGDDAFTVVMSASVAQSTSGSLFIKAGSGGESFVCLNLDDDKGYEVMIAVRGSIGSDDFIL